MAKLGDFKTPTGQAGSVFSLGSWTQSILGVFVLMISFAMGQRLVQATGKRVPGGFIDTQIENPIVESKALVHTKHDRIY